MPQESTQVKFWNLKPIYKFFSPHTLEFLIWLQICSRTLSESNQRAICCHLLKDPILCYLKFCVKLITGLHFLKYQFQLPLMGGPMGGGTRGGLNEGGDFMSLTPKCDMFLESPRADPTGNVGKVGNLGKV